MNELVESKQTFIGFLEELGTVVCRDVTCTNRHATHPGTLDLSPWTPLFMSLLIFSHDLQSTDTFLLNTETVVSQMDVQPLDSHLSVATVSAVEALHRQPTDYVAKNRKC